MFQEKFLRRFYVIGIQIRTSFINNEDISTIFECAEKIKEFNYNYRKKEIKYFITSDSFQLEESLKTRYRDDILNINSLNIKQAHGGLARSIIDLEILSLCDELVLSGGSTFGFLASIKKGELPFYVNGKRQVKSCVKMKLSEPSTRPEGFAVF